MYNYYQPQNQAQQPIRQQLPAILKGHPVSSVDEVRAASIDFDGSIFFFPDLANKRIFTKQINMDGTASLYMYELKELPLMDNNTNNNYITRDEFNAALEKIQLSLNPVKPKEEAKYEF